MEKLFLVEGEKNISDVLYSTIIVKQLFATSGFISKHKAIINNVQQIFEVSEEELSKASLLKSPQDGLALCEIPAISEIPAKINDNLVIYLDGIQDPGNLGTIVRVCDWFGIDYLFCSPDTVDMFNPKVIQATMGSFCKVQTQKVSIDEMIQLAKKSRVSIFGAYTEGNNIYREELPVKALLVMGNEGNGIRPDLEQFIENKISIPKFTSDAESLNVAIATAIICSEFRRSW